METSPERSSEVVSLVPVPGATRVTYRWSGEPSIEPCRLVLLVDQSLLDALRR